MHAYWSRESEWCAKLICFGCISVLGGGERGILPSEVPLICLNTSECLPSLSSLRSNVHGCCMWNTHPSSVQTPSQPSPSRLPYWWQCSPWVDHWYLWLLVASIITTFLIPKDSHSSHCTGRGTCHKCLPSHLLSGGQASICHFTSTSLLPAFLS